MWQSLQATVAEYLTMPPAASPVPPAARRLVERERRVSDSYALYCHVGLDGVAPLFVVFGFFVRFRVFGGFVDFVEGEVGGVVVRLEDVEADVAGLLAGVFVVVEGDFLEILYVFRLYVDVSS